MKYLVMTLPDDPQDLRSWLETVIVHGDAGRLADELAAIQPVRRRIAPELSADALQPVLQRGLLALDDRQLQVVLANPRQLRSLAEAVFLKGGDYWQQQFSHIDTFDNRVTHGWRQLQSDLFADEPVIPLATVPKTRRTVSPWVASIATAAAMLLAFYLIPGSQPTPPPTPQVAVAPPRWGWQKADELAAIAKPADYLDRIANLADEWKTQPTPTAVALADKIAEFRQGCSRLQLMEHKPLNAEQRQDLLARCQKWAKKFDENLIALETTGETAKVRAAMDATVTQLTTVLHEQAMKLRDGA